MIAKYLYAVAPAVADHLWQSTLFAVAAGLLTIVLRKNRAGARYWLWLAASLKFLLPFSLLSAVGNGLAFLRSPVAPSEGLSFAVEVASQPFTMPITRPSLPVAAGPNAWVPILLGLWFCGFIAVLIIWYTRWRRISAAIRESEPLREGRELEALRRIQTDDASRIEMLLSRTSLEPGIFGIVHPVMVWPEGISSHLEDEHLEAILAHELWHVRRRDNLAAAVHMVVEAVFWFHPLVWWLGTRLVQERERACDEEVLALGGERQVYAESILKVCEFCVGSPLACVAGVTGADLKKRIVHIMTKNVVRKLDFSRKVLLSVAGLVVVALPVGFGLLRATPVGAESQSAAAIPVASMFEAVSVRLNQSGSPMPPFKIEGDPGQMRAIAFQSDKFMATLFTLQGLIEKAYGVSRFQILGGPAWLNSAKYDIYATIEKSEADRLKMLSREQGGFARNRMLQALLEDRFKLRVHREPQNLPVYALECTTAGPNLKRSEFGVSEQISREGAGKVVGKGVSIETLVRVLTEDAEGRELGRAVIDRTGLTGNYDFELQWTPGVGDGPPDSSLSDALREQLGLELKSQIGPVQILAIDHAEKPAGN